MRRGKWIGLGLAFGLAVTVLAQGTGRFTTIALVDMDGTAAGVTLTHDGDGALTITGNGDGSDEDLTLNLDDTANVADVTSSTGVTEVQFSSIGLDAASYAVAGAAGGTGSSCSAFTGGICTTASEDDPIAALWAEVARLRAEIETLKAQPSTAGRPPEE